MPDTAELTRLPASNDMHSYAQSIVERAPRLYAEMNNNRKEGWLRKITHNIRRRLFPPRGTK